MKRLLIFAAYLSIGAATFPVAAAETASVTQRGIPVIFHACPSWCNPRGFSEQFRFCYDRPFAPGDEPDYVWQLRTMKEAVPNSALAIYCFVNERRTVDYWCDIFQKYLDAAAQTGAKVFPTVHAVDGDLSKRPQDLENLATELLKRFGDNPNWYQWKGRPFMMDYGNGGIQEPEVLNATIQKIREASRPIFYVSEPLSDVDWAVKGTFLPTAIQSLLREADGVYHFTQPLDGGLGGYKNLSEAIRRAGSDKIYGAGIQAGYYASRKDARNFISSRGTLTLRKGFAAAQAVPIDLLHLKTWNDWVEATSVEPSYDHTHALLDLITEFADILNKAPFPADTQPRVVASYRKNVFPGENLDVEILNLPVAPAFGRLSGKVSLKTSSGKALGEKNFSNLDGTALDGVVLSFPILGDLTRDMIEVSVEVTSARAGKPYHRFYEGLPPVPVVVNSVQADMLEFKVPLHRLNPNAKVRLQINGADTAQANLSAPNPRLLSVAVQGGEPVQGVAYLKDGSVINDPDAASRSAVIDNWMSDPSLEGAASGNDYYGALVAFPDGTVAYSNGAWVNEPAAQGGWASYQFEKENKFARYPAGENKLRDLSGHKLHGDLCAPAEQKPPQWINVAPQLDVLKFDGKGQTVLLPLDSALPGPMSVEMAICPDGVDRQQELLTQRGASISLRLEKGGRVSARRLDENREFKTVTSTEALTASQWHFITATYDMKKLKLYVDGKFAGEVEARGLRSSEKVVLGGPLGTSDGDGLVDKTSADSYFAGVMGLLRILDGPLDADSVSTQARQALLVFSGL